MDRSSACFRFHDRLAAAGLDPFTISASLLVALCAHGATADAAAQFERDAAANRS
ncbi:MAG: hypothetical protein ACK5FE_01960 [Cyanobacteriota bacterium]